MLGYTQAAQKQTNTFNKMETYNMSDDKQKTLCAYVEEEVQVNDPQAYIALIKPATHYCQGCGRSAAKAENLCKPQKL
jgi:hypothetical protein